jgi:hypothetical protein
LILALIHVTLFFTPIFLHFLQEVKKKKNQVRAAWKRARVVKKIALNFIKLNGCLEPGGFDLL